MLDYPIEWEFKLRLNEVKAFGGCHKFSKVVYRASSIKSDEFRRGGIDENAPVYLELRQVHFSYTSLRIAFNTSIRVARSAGLHPEKIVTIRQIVTLIAVSDKGI